jgi:hypothetical protein
VAVGFAESSGSVAVEGSQGGDVGGGADLDGFSVGGDGLV